MYAPVRRFGGLALLGLLLLCSAADAQRILYPGGTSIRPQIVPFPVNPNQFIAPNLTARQAAFNMAVIGRGLSQVPPWAFGYNPYPSPIISTGRLLPQVAPMTPFGLSTIPGGNPYVGAGAAGLTTDPYGAGGYSLSTTPYGNFGNPYGGMMPFFPGYGYPPGDGFGYGAALQGVASVTAATGQYWKDIQTARITREQSRQMALETARRRIQMEAWYESQKMTAGQLRERTMAADLERARKEATANDVWSAKALNDLLRSINSQGSVKVQKGPDVKLSDETLKRLNLTGRTSSDNVGLLRTALRADKKEAALESVWPDSLRGQKFDTLQKRLRENIFSAATILDGDQDSPVPVPLRKDIRSDYDALVKAVDENHEEMSAAQFIEARRFLNQLNGAIRVLDNPRANNYFKDRQWAARGNTISGLVENMAKEGLTFASATPGDEGAYTSLYYALREFEAGLQGGNGR